MPENLLKEKLPKLLLGIDFVDESQVRSQKEVACQHSLDRLHSHLEKTACSQAKIKHAFILNGYTRRAVCMERRM